MCLQLIHVEKEAPTEPFTRVISIVLALYPLPPTPPSRHEISRMELIAIMTKLNPADTETEIKIELKRTAHSMMLPTTPSVRRR